MTVLGLSAIEARYELLTAVHPLTLDVAEAEVVSLIGANGAGKTTLMRVLAGAHPLAGGTLTFNGANIGGLRAHERVRAGIAMAPEGRRLFADMTGGGASADAMQSRLGAFINARYITGDQDDNRVQDGYDFDGWGALLGMDYRFTDNLVAGLALNYSDGEVDYDRRAGKLDTQTWGATAYGTYYLEDGWFFEGSAGYSRVDYDMTRHIVYSIAGNAANQAMTSSPEGDLVTLSVGGGYVHNSEAWSITPSLRLDYVENDVDGYSERSTDLQQTGGAMALAVGSITYESFTSNLGVQLANAISTASGVIIPQASATWVHEFEDGGETIRARYRDDINQTGFLIATTDLDSDYFDLALGVSGQFQGGRSAFISYRTIVGYDGLSYSLIEAGLRFEL